MKFFPQFALAAAVLALTTSTALAHPHETDKDEKTEVKKAWPNFGNSDSDDDETREKKVIIKKFKFDSDEAADDIREAGKAIEDALTESGMITDLADMLAELAEDFDVEDGEDGMKVFKFDGKKMGHFKMDRESSDSDRMNIGGLGQNLSIERETYVKDGKTKTRIVIEMDGGEDVEIDLPDLEGKAKSEN